MFLWCLLILLLVCSYFWPCDGTFPLLPSSGAVYLLEPFWFAKFKTRLVSQFPLFLFLIKSCLLPRACVQAKWTRRGEQQVTCLSQSTQPRTDGAAGSVWQITLLVVGLNPAPTAVSSSTTQNLSRVTVIRARTCRRTQRERCRYEQNTEYLPPVRLELFIIPGFLSDPPKHQKPISRQKRLNIKYFA